MKKCVLNKTPEGYIITLVETPETHATDLETHIKTPGTQAVEPETPQQTEGELFISNFKREHGDVDSGAIQISLGMAALAIIWLSLPTNSANEIDTIFILKLLGGVVFILSIFTTIFLSWSYICMRIPITLTHYFKSTAYKKYGLPLHFWLILHYPSLVLRMVFSNENPTDPERITELAYLTLIATILLAIGISGAYVMLIIYP